MMAPASRDAILSEEGWFVWCGTMTRDDDGVYHMYYSRWRKELGFNAWVTHSQVAHATASTPFGPFTFSDVALQMAAGLSGGGGDIAESFNISVPLKDVKR